MGFFATKRTDKKIVRQGSAAHVSAGKNERQVMARLGGTVTPRSGAGAKKGDGQVKGIARIECKGTTKNSFSVTKDQLRKNDVAALYANEYPVLVVQFLNSEGKPEDEQAVMRFSDLQDLIERLRKAESCQP